MVQPAIDSLEIIKYLVIGLFTIIGTIGGSYIVFVIKAIGKDIKSLKELLMTHVGEIKSDIVSIERDIQMLFNLHRQNEKDIAAHVVEISGIKDECNQRRMEGKWTLKIFSEIIL